MDVFSISPGGVLLSSYDGSVQLIDSQLKAVSMLKRINNLHQERRIDEWAADRIRRAIMVAFVDINSVEAYSLSGDVAVESRQIYREAIVDAIVRDFNVTSPQPSNKTIHLIRGITGSGKTTYAVRLKEKLGANGFIETDQIKDTLFRDFWSKGMGVCPEPRQLHKEASLICEILVDKLCRRGMGFILVQRFEKMKDAERIMQISENYGYKWNIYSITPDYVDIARNNITRSRSILNINTFSPKSLQKAITEYTKTASYFYRLATLPNIFSMCDVQQRAHGVFEEIYYKKDGINMYVDNNPSIHSPLISSRDSKEIENYALFVDADMQRYENFFHRNENSKAIKASALRILHSISRSANGNVNLVNKDSSTCDILNDFYATHRQTQILRELVEFIYNKRFLSINDKDDLKNFIFEVVRRSTGLSNKHLFRTRETGKYLLVCDIKEHFNSFISNLFDKIRHERNRVYVASYILWSIDFTGHYFADGCSRVSTLIALWYLMRTGCELPVMERRLDDELNVRSSYRGRYHMNRKAIYSDINKDRFKSFYRYYKSLFKKPARPVILCAGGYIFNQRGEMLLLRSSKGKDVGKYVIPGGKMNREECAQECFARETGEETGLSIENISFLGKRKYIAPSGRRYLMYDFTAQASNTSVNINCESVASEWIFPIDINFSECTASTLDGFKKYLYIDEIIKGIAVCKISKFKLRSDQVHATGVLEKAYVRKKMTNYLWALQPCLRKIIIHGILPFNAAISSRLPEYDSGANSSKSGFVCKDRNSNALRPSSFLDVDNKTLHLFNFPGNDILKHYALLFSRYPKTASCTINIANYPKISKSLIKFTGLKGNIVRNGDIVYLGYSTRLKEFLYASGVKPVSVVENFWYISSRFKLENSVINVLECKYGHWGDIAASLSWQLCKLGAKTIIHNGKVGTIVNQSEVYSRVYIPSQFAIYHSCDGVMSAVPIDNVLSSFIPFRSGCHVSCSTPLDETNHFLETARAHHIETVDIESSKIAKAIADYNDRYNCNINFGAIHYASDYVGLPDIVFTSYNLSNEHDKNPQTWKDAVLQDIFNVIVYSIKNSLDR